jgi:hypothetical protein
MTHEDILLKTLLEVKNQIGRLEEGQNDIKQILVTHNTRISSCEENYNKIDKKLAYTAGAISIISGAIYTFLNTLL